MLFIAIARKSLQRSLLFIIITAALNAYAIDDETVQSRDYSNLSTLYSGGLKPDMVVADISLGTLSFNSETFIATAVLQSRRKDEALATIGLALFDKQQQLLAIAQSQKAHMFAKTAIFPGKDKELIFDFSPFLDSFSAVHSMKIVMRVADIEVVKSRKKR